MKANLIGTICHNDDNAWGIKHRRVQLLILEDGYIWAKDGQKLEKQPELPKPANTADAVEICAQHWGGLHWDFQEDEH